MRTFLLGIAILASTSLALGRANLREVDFKNFTYPLSGPLLGHNSLRWLRSASDGPSRRKAVQLKNGKDLTKTSSPTMDGKDYAQFEGFTLQSVVFADVTGDGKEDAIVVLLYRTGGTQNTNYV